MDHSYIEEHNIIARYEMGKLSSTDRARFEEHFVDCPECQEQLTATEDFRQGLKTVVLEDAEDPTRSHLPAKPSWFAWLAPARGWRLALVGLAACLGLALLSTIVLLRDMRHVHSELGQAKIAAETWQRQFTEERQARVNLEKRLNEIERQVKENSEAAAKLPVVASILPLTTVRSGDASGSGPVNQITVPRLQQWIVFSLDLEGAQSVHSYRVVLSERTGRVLWKESRLTPGPANTLGIGVPSKLLHQGDYLLTLEGLSPEGHSLISQTYLFRVKLAK